MQKCWFGRWPKQRVGILEDRYQFSIRLKQEEQTTRRVEEPTGSSDHSAAGAQLTLHERQTRNFLEVGGSRMPGIGVRGQWESDMDTDWVGL